MPSPCLLLLRDKSVLFFKKSFFPIWDCDLLISQFADAFLSHWKLFNRIVSLVQLIGRYFYEIKSTRLSWISWCDWLILDHLLSTVIYIHTVWNEFMTLFAARYLTLCSAYFAVWKLMGFVKTVWNPIRIFNSIKKCTVPSIIKHNDVL